MKTKGAPSFMKLLFQEALSGHNHRWVTKIAVAESNRERRRLTSRSTFNEGAHHMPNRKVARKQACTAAPMVGEEKVGKRSVDTVQQGKEGDNQNDPRYSTRKSQRSDKNAKEIQGAAQETETYKLRKGL